MYYLKKTFISHSISIVLSVVEKLLMQNPLEISEPTLILIITIDALSRGDIFVKGKGDRSL